MADFNAEMLDHYQRELSYLRHSGAAFAQRYPKVANRLQLSGDESPDPHVERLLESFAFLTARLQQNVENDFPEITTALLGVLFPQFTTPIPAMTVAKFEVDPEQAKITSGHPIARETQLFAETGQGIVCRFRTCYPVTLWPVKISQAVFEPTDKYDFLDDAPDIATVLRLRVETLGDPLSDLEMTSLRFYLNGVPTTTSDIYELLFAHLKRVAVLVDDEKRPRYLPDSVVRPVGLEQDEAVMPYPDQGHPGYRLLMEYFSYPEKFHFFDVDGLDTSKVSKHFDILFLLDQPKPRRLSLAEDTFQLGCAPVINLFRKTSEPIRLDHRRTEYRLSPDLRREDTTEIHSIERVSASSDASTELEIVAPYFAYDHHMEGAGQESFWFARRRYSSREDIRGTEMHVSFVDLDMDPSEPPSQTVFAHTLCTNRLLAEQVPPGAELHIEETVPVKYIKCLHAPTPPRYPPMGGDTYWRLISHLSLNYLSLSEGGPKALAALREILKLYSFNETSAVHQQINGIREMTCRKVVRRTGEDAWRGFARGTAIELLFDESNFVGSSAFLLASVLNRFFGMYASCNSFTELAITSRDRDGIWKKWQPVAGTESLL
tara:strand:- start:41235 stop:43046 length:1812 start_codon:yes stop_codon:yes gene_type:complete